jgi:cupin 2 domain-containing protein
MPPVTNLFSSIPGRIPSELFETLAENSSVRIERIVSHGHASPDGFWYDQPRNEWVVVLKGAARLRFEGETSPVEMGVGDAVLIPARRRHRVDRTTPDGPTVWLAVHFDGELNGLPAPTGPAVSSPE